MSADRTNPESIKDIQLFHGLGELHLRPWRELSAVALISLDLSWLSIGYLYFSTAAQGMSFTAVYLLFGLNMSSAYVLARAMFLLKFKPAARRVLLLCAFLIVTLIMLQNIYDPSSPLNLLAPWMRMLEEMRAPGTLIPADLLLVGLSAYLWYRAVSLAHRWIDPAVATRSFSFAALMLILLGVLMAFGEAETWSAGLALFTLSGLLALGTARAATLGRLRGGRSTRFSSPWILGILFSTVAVETLALTSSRLASGFLAAWTAVVFILLIRAVLILSALLVSPLLLVLMLGWPWFRQQLDSSQMLQSIGRELSDLVSFITRFLVDLSKWMQGLFESMPDISRWRPFILGSAVLLLFAALAHWFGRDWRLPWRGGVDASEDADRLNSRRTAVRFLLNLQAGLRQLGDRLGRLRLGRGLLGALRIRRLYTRLMSLCSELGFPRTTTETPLEFLPTLWQLFPRSREEARLMTEAYNRVRYGERPETRSEVELVEQAWSRIKGEAGRLRQAQRQIKVQRRDDS